MGKFAYMLAPIERVTCAAFRSVAHKHGADITFTEQDRTEGLVRGTKDAWDRIELKDSTPTIIQLTGIKEEQFRDFLRKFEPHDGFKGFNLNCGCPSKDVMKLGVGCAMMNKIDAVKKILEVFKDHGYNMSIKMRLGITKQDKEKKAYLDMINKTDAEYYVVHARYGEQSYKSLADFSAYEGCVKTGKDIIANGDIRTKEHIEFLEGIGAKGAMIGRAAIFDPAIFNRLKGIEDKPAKDILGEVKELAIKFADHRRYARTMDNLCKNPPQKIRINTSYIQQCSPSHQ